VALLGDAEPETASTRVGLLEVSLQRERGHEQEARRRADATGNRNTTGERTPPTGDPHRGEGPAADPPPEGRSTQGTHTEHTQTSFALLEARLALRPSLSADGIPVGSIPAEGSAGAEATCGKDRAVGLAREHAKGGLAVAEVRRDGEGSASARAGVKWTRTDQDLAGKDGGLAIAEAVKDAEGSASNRVEVESIRTDRELAGKDGGLAVAEGGLALTEDRQEGAGAAFGSAAGRKEAVAGASFFLAGGAPGGALGGAEVESVRAVPIWPEKRAGWP